MIDKEFHDLQIEVATFIATMKEWMSTTIEYRIIHNNRMDDINKKVEIVDTKLDNLITTLPCKERKGWYDSMSRQIAFIWIIITLLLGAVGFEWIRR